MTALMDFWMAESEELRAAEAEVIHAHRWVHYTNHLGTRVMRLQYGYTDGWPAGNYCQHLHRTKKAAIACVRQAWLNEKRSK